MEGTELKPLTDKQQRVLDLLSEGKTQSEIANDMGIKSLAGVNSHIAALTKKGYLDKNGAPTQGSTPVEDSPPDISGGDEEAEASSNGSHVAFDNGDVAESLRAAIENIDRALSEHQERQAEIAREAEERAADVGRLTEARVQASTALTAIS
jgi:SOS-response transcriptional repressor LexA